jgi:hypothetical protein
LTPAYMVPNRGMLPAKQELICSFNPMPTDACQFFYDCKGCGERLKPLAGDCCVFCSYGSVPCPPVQSNLRCCVSEKRRAIPD